MKVVFNGKLGGRHIKIKTYLGVFTILEFKGCYQISRRRVKKILKAYDRFSTSERGENKRFFGSYRGFDIVLCPGYIKIGCQYYYPETIYPLRKLLKINTIQL